MAALPLVSWLPEVLTPGRLIFALPSNDTPPIFLAFAKVVAVEALPVTAPSKFATSVPVVIVKLPVEAPVNEPVPTINLSALSSKPINALSESPLSMTIPMSLPGVPVVPVPNSINLSSIVELVVDSVVVVPFTVKLPVTTKLFPTVRLLLKVESPAAAISIVNASIVEPPSLPLILNVLSWVICKSKAPLPPELANLANWAPPSFKYTLPPSASNVMWPVASNSNWVPSVDTILSIVGVVNVLLVKVCEPANVATVESIAIEIWLSETVVSTPVPPAKVSVSVPTTTPSFEPLSAATVNVVDIASTYALILCWEATATAELELKSSSSKNAVPLNEPFNTGLVNVLFVKVCEAVNNVIAAVLDKSVLAIVMLPVPSKLCPAIVLAVSNAVAVAAFPVVDPEEPDTLPVTLPVILPVNVPAIAPVPVIVGLVKVLFVNVWVPANVATVESIATVSVLPEPDVSIPVPPVNVIVSESKSIERAPPESPWKSKSEAVTCESTYALIDCCVASDVALLDDISSSSAIAVIPSNKFNSVEVAVSATFSLNLGDVRVLFVSVAVVPENKVSNWASVTRPSVPPSDNISRSVVWSVAPVKSVAPSMFMIASTAPNSIALPAPFTFKTCPAEPIDKEAPKPPCVKGTNSPDWYSANPVTFDPENVARTGTLELIYYNSEISGICPGLIVVTAVPLAFVKGK